MEHFGAQFIFPGAAAVRRPQEPRIADLARSSETRQLGENPREHGFCALAVVRRTKGAAHRVIDEDRSWWKDLAHNIDRRAGQQSGYPLSFEHVRNETDGLMTERSVGYEQREINFGSGQFTSDGGRKLAFNFLLAPDAAHDRDMKGRQ